MSRQLATAAVILLTAGPSLGATVMLQNGDTLTGEVTDRSEERLVLEHATLGVLKIERDKIAAVSPEEEAPDQGPDQDNTSRRANVVEKQSGRDTPAKAGQAEGWRSDKPLETTVLPEWEKSLALGFSGTQGNAENASFNAQLQFKKNTDKARVDFNNKFFYATSGDDTTQNEFESQLNLDWLQPDSDWFYFMQSGYEFDEFEPWRHRVSLYGGPGYTFLDTKEVEIVGRLGAGANYEFGSINDLTPEGLVGTETIRWHLTDNQNLTGGITYYPSFESVDEYRLTTNAEWQIKIDRASGLSLKFGLENEYESITESNTQHNDLKYYGALNYDF